MKRLTAVLAFSALFSLSCSDKGIGTNLNEPAGKRLSSPRTQSAPVKAVNDLAGTRQEEPLLVVSGRIENPKGISYGRDARVVGFWSGDRGEGDFTYVFGFGEIDPEAGTFRLEFHAPPPDSASYGGIFGVGALVVVADASLEEGLVPEAFLDNKAILGASPRHYVVFHSGDPEVLRNVPWVEPFPSGLSVGRGIQIPDSFFEGFEPVDPGSVLIILDDLNNLDFVNWS